MDSDEKEKIYFDNDGQYRINCYISDKLAKDRCSNKQLKPQNHINNFRKRQQFLIQIIQHHFQLKTMLWILKKLFLLTKVI